MHQPPAEPFPIKMLGQQQEILRVGLFFKIEKDLIEKRVKCWDTIKIVWMWPNNLKINCLLGARSLFGMKTISHPSLVPLVKTPTTVNRGLRQANMQLDITTTTKHLWGIFKCVLFCCLLNDYINLPGACFTGSVILKRLAVVSNFLYTVHRILFSNWGGKVGSQKVLNNYKQALGSLEEWWCKHALGMQMQFTVNNSYHLCQAFHVYYLVVLIHMKVCVIISVL